ncbi:MAG: hypothetical protein OXM01_03325 [Gemmatimonadota bacterium]|nr:hypothetical protein [Gemmatimonadota bacterium]
MASYPLHIIPENVQQDIVSELSLTDRANYEVQNRGTNPIRAYNGGQSAPAANQGIEIPPLDYFTFDVATGVALWLWGVNGPAVIAYNDDG